MKKYLALFLVVILLTANLCACGSQVEAKGTNSADKNQNGSDKKLEIVTTIFPEYDWVRNLVDGTDGANLTMLLDNGVDLHSYQPTVSDIMKIANCDLFIYVGGESDEWVDDVLEQNPNSKRKVINLLDALGDAVKAEEIVEGMEHDHEDGEEHDHEDGDEDHDHEDGDEKHGHSHEEELDEHVWLSLRNASTLCETIANTLCELDGANKDAYQANLKAYKAQLSDLDQQYAEAVKSAKYTTLLFGDRFPFRYLTDDYDLTYYAAFAGCSAESEASFETVKFLADKLSDLGLPAIMKIEGKNKKIAETIRDASTNKSAEILTIDSLQSVTAKDVEAGASYVKIMTENLEVLKKALN